MPNQNQPQADRFKQIARQLECDEDEARFNERLKRIARKSEKPKDDERHTKEKP